MRSAMSRVAVGEKNWSSTTETASPAAALASKVSTKLLPFPELPACPNNPEPRTTRESEMVSRTNRSPEAFDTPYTLMGPVGSSST